MEKKKVNGKKKRFPSNQPTANFCKQCKQFKLEADFQQARSHSARGSRYIWGVIQAISMADRRRNNGPPGGTRPPVFASLLRSATGEAAERPHRTRQPNELRKICTFIPSMIKLQLTAAETEFKQKFSRLVWFPPPAAPRTWRSNRRARSKPNP